MISTLNITGSIVGSPLGGPITLGLAPIVNSSSPGFETGIELLSGDNTIAIPPLTDTVIVQLPVGNAVAIGYKKTGGTDVTQISPNGGVFVFTPGPGVSSFILNAASGVTQNTYLGFL